MSITLQRSKPATYNHLGRRVHSASWAILDCPGLFCQWSYQIGGPPDKKWAVLYSRPEGERGVTLGLMIATSLMDQRFPTRREALQAVQAALILEGQA